MLYYTSNSSSCCVNMNVKGKHVWAHLDKRNIVNKETELKKGKCRHKRSKLCKMGRKDQMK